MSEWNMDGKNVAIMIIIVLLFYKIVLFIRRLEDHRQQRSSFERLGVPKLG